MRVSGEGVFREAVGFGEGRGRDEHAARCAAVAAAVADGEAKARKLLLAELGPASAKSVSKTSSVSKAFKSESASAAAPPPDPGKSSNVVDVDDDDEEKAAREAFAQAEARRLELRKQKEKEEEVERLRIEQEEEEERIRVEQEVEEERLREEKKLEEEKKQQEEERKKAEEKKRAAEEETAAAAPPSSGPSASTSPRMPAPASSSPVPVKRNASSDKLVSTATSQESPNQTRKAPTVAGPPAPAARPKALGVKTGAAAPPPMVMPAVVPRSAPVPTATARGPVRSPVAPNSPALVRVPSTAAAASPPPQQQAGERKQLSLSSRKNVKQFQPTFAEHAQRLMEVIGPLQIQSKVDWTELADVCDDGGFKNACGEVFFDKVMGGLVNNLMRLSSGARDELAAQWTGGGISLRFDEAQETQWSARLADGDLELTSRGEPWLDVDKAGLDLVEELEAGFGTPVANAGVPAAAAANPLAQNVAAFAKVFAEHAAAMQKAADLPVLPSHNVNFEELNGHLKKLGKADSAGELFLSGIVGALARNVVSLCQKRLVAGVLRNLWGTGVISLAFNEQQKDAWTAQLLRGACVVSVRPSALLSSPETVGRRMLDLAVEGDSGLPVLSAQSMQDHDREIQDLLERLRVAAGLSFSVVADVDFFEVTMLVNALPGLEHQVGRVWVSILSSLASQMEIVSTQPDALEILSTLFSNGVLKLSIDESLDEGVWQTDFVDGDLILFSNPKGIHLVNCTFLLFQLL